MIEPGTRRGFLIGALALMTAPAIVRANSLMKIVPVDVYDTRCLWGYEIMSDQMVLRVDRRLETMVRLSHVQQIPLKVAKSLFGENHPIFTMKPEPGDQKMATMAVTSGQFQRAGLSPPWAACRSVSA